VVLAGDSRYSFKNGTTPMVDVGVGSCLGVAIRVGGSWSSAAG
jgi:hypothetical protein